MPSLSTNSANVKGEIGTYHFIVPFATDEDFSERASLSITESIIFVIKNIVMLSLITFLVYCCSFLAIYLILNEPEIYENYHLFYFFDFYSNNLMLFFFYFVLIVYLPGFCIKRVKTSLSNSNSFGNRYFCPVDTSLCVLVYLVIDAIIIFAVVTDYEYSGSSNSWTHERILNFDCNVFYCDAETVGYLFFLVIMPIISPMFHVMLLLIGHFCFVYYCNCCNTSNSKQMNEMKIPMVEYNQKETDSIEMNNGEWDIDNEGKNGLIWMKIRFYIWLLLYLFVFGLLVFASFFYSNLEVSKIHNNWELYYWSLLVSTSIAKFFLKRIGRKLDCIKIRYFLLAHTNNSKNIDIVNNIDPSKMFSIEWFSEALGTVYYWFNFRTESIYYLPFISTQQFATTIGIHLLSEIFQTSLRLSRFYFNNSSKLLEFAIDCNIFYNDCNWINNYMKNNLDCNYNQWKQRLSIEMLLHLFTSVVSSIWSLGYLLLLWFCEFHFGLNSESKAYFKTFYFLLIVFAVELIVYVIAFALHFKLEQENLLNHVSYLWNYYFAQFLLVWMVCNMFVMLQY